MPHASPFPDTALQSTLEPERVLTVQTVDLDLSVPVDPRSFTSFAQFYPFYLGEHRDTTCRRLHFAGSTLALLCLLAFASTGQPGWLLAGLLAGYALAWVGHFVFEHNKPASFKRPLYSFLGDWAMYRDIWLGKIPF
jgi:hypothetical protein